MWYWVWVWKCYTYTTRWQWANWLFLKIQVKVRILGNHWLTLTKSCTFCPVRRICTFCMNAQYMCTFSWLCYHPFQKEQLMQTCLYPIYQRYLCNVTKTNSWKAVQHDSAWDQSVESCNSLSSLDTAILPYCITADLSSVSLEEGPVFSQRLWPPDVCCISPSADKETMLAFEIQLFQKCMFYVFLHYLW